LPSLPTAPLRLLASRACLHICHANSKSPTLLPLLLTWHAMWACQRGSEPGSPNLAWKKTILPPSPFVLWPSASTHSLPRRRCGRRRALPKHHRHMVPLPAHHPPFLGPSSPAAPQFLDGESRLFAHLLSFLCHGLEVMMQARRGPPMASNVARELRRGYMFFLRSGFGVREAESPSLVLVINDTKLLMPLCQVV
jgi:hypothetical protein